MLTYRILADTLKAENSFFTKVLRTQLVESKTEVEVQQRDPNSPLYSVKTFEELNLWVGVRSNSFHFRLSTFTFAFALDLSCERNTESEIFYYPLLNEYHYCII